MLVRENTKQICTSRNNEISMQCVPPYQPLTVHNMMKNRTVQCSTVHYSRAAEDAYVFDLVHSCRHLDIQGKRVLPCSVQGRQYDPSLIGQKWCSKSQKYDDKKKQECQKKTKTIRCLKTILKCTDMPYSNSPSPQGIQKQYRRRRIVVEAARYCPLTGRTG